MDEEELKQIDLDKLEELKGNLEIEKNILLGRTHKLINIQEVE